MKHLSTSRCAAKSSLFSWCSVQKEIVFEIASRDVCTKRVMQCGIAEHKKGLHLKLQHELLVQND